MSKVLNVILILIILVLLFTISNSQDNFFNEESESDKILIEWLPVTAPEGINAECFVNGYRPVDAFLQGTELRPVLNYGSVVVCFDKN